MCCENFYNLAEKLLLEARKNNFKIAFAESCTGGLIGAAITEIAGSSENFNGSAVVYSNEAKNKILSVSNEILNSAGAVSSECALAMAKGALKIYNSDFALSVTGIAGPDGGTDLKPVGTVYFGVASNINGVDDYAFKENFTGNRKNIRSQTVETALKELCLIIHEVNLKSKTEAD